MPELAEAEIRELLQPYLADLAPPENLFANLGKYLDLLIRWNARTNLTAIREPVEVVQRHFGESLFTALKLQSRLQQGAELLDYGSGAGFPGIPIQLALPELRCCLAESQGKKAAFLREAVRTLGLRSKVWAGRVEDMVDSRRFECVTLRAVDQMNAAVLSAQSRLTQDGYLAVLGSADSEPSLSESFDNAEQFAIPGGHSRVLYLYRHCS